MKLFFLSVLIILSACSHKEKPEQNSTATIEKIDLILESLGQDSRFSEFMAGRYQLTLGPDSEIKIFRYEFSNQKELVTYQLNRRMLLHREFQDNIAPYTGMVESDKNCIQNVKVDAEIKKVGAHAEYFSMQFPITKVRVISDCLKNDVWGATQFIFYSCKKQNRLYEIRYIKGLTAPPTEILINCN